MPSFSRNLEQTLHRAIALAGQRRHEYATLEHLLLSLLEDSEGMAFSGKYRSLFLANVGSREERLEALFEGRPYDMLDAALTDTISGELEGRFGWQPTPHPATGRPGRWCTASATGRRLPQAVR